jgi:hypothetical protein
LTAKKNESNPVLVSQAKEVAEHWVRSEGSKMPGWRGAYLVGSVTTLPDWAAVPETSDVDVTVVLDEARAQKLGKLMYQGLLLEVSFVQWDEIQSYETILGESQMAGAYQAAHILADPTGHLTRLQEEVASQFARRAWVRQRCLHARDKVLGCLHSLDESAPLHAQVNAWLFGTSLTTLILTVAALQAPTVRRRYVEVRELLAKHGRLDFYQELLQLLGCSGWSRGQTTRHLAAVAAAFDEAKSLPKGDFRFAADISYPARAVAVGGSRTLIEQGLHREAVFWMVATYSRCQWIFYYNAADEAGVRFLPGFQSMLGDLGIGSFADLQYRSGQVIDFLPRIAAMAEAIMAATPEIE